MLLLRESILSFHYLMKTTKGINGFISAIQVDDRQLAAEVIALTKLHVPGVSNINRDPFRPFLVLPSTTLHLSLFREEGKKSIAREVGATVLLQFPLSLPEMRCRNLPTFPVSSSRAPVKHYAIERLTF